MHPRRSSNSIEVDNSVSFVDEDDDAQGSGDELSLRPKPVNQPSTKPSSRKPAAESESFELSSSGDFGTDTGSKLQATNNSPQQGAFRQQSGTISPGTTGPSSFTGLSSSGLGEHTAHSPNLGSSADSKKPGPAAPGGSSRPMDPLPRLPMSPNAASGRTSPTGRTSPVPTSSYGSSFDGSNISLGESGNNTPRRPVSPSAGITSAGRQPTGKGQQGAGLQQNNTGQQRQQQQNQQQAEDVQAATGMHSSAPRAAQKQSIVEQQARQQHEQQEQAGRQQQQQQQIERASLPNLEPPEPPHLPPGLRPGASESPNPMSIQAALKKQQEAKAQAEQAIQEGGLGSTCNETGIDIPSPLQLFMMYDTDGSCAMDMGEFGQMLYDLDGMDEVPPAIRNKYVMEQFDLADLNHDGVISIDEFYFYFYRELCFKFPILRSGVNPGADLFNIFVKYATFGRAERSEEMTSNQFTKLCKDCKLVNNKTVTKADIDIIFSRCRIETNVLEAFRPKMGSEYTTARMMYPQFLFGLLKVAEKRRSGFQEVVARIIENVSAMPRATMADLLVFQNTGDPKQAEEWVMRPRGLPRLPHIAGEAAERMQREAALAKSLKLPCPSRQRGSKSGMQSMQSTSALGDSGQAGLEPVLQEEVEEAEKAEEALEISEALACTKTKKQWGLQGFGSAESLNLPCTGRAALTDPRALIAIRKLSPDHLLMGLKRVFERYNKWQHGTNKGTMDKVRFNKMMRDARFVRECGPMTGNLADQIFHCCLPMVEETLNFMQFLTALKHVAAVLRVSLNEVMEAIVLINAPLDA